MATTAQTFGTTPMTPEQQALADAYNAKLLAEAEELAPEPLFQHYPPAPELSLNSLRVELGARPLVDISSDPPPPLILDRIDPEGHTVLFGDGGVGKGTVASSWAIGCVNAGMRVLIVDYENHPGEWSRRVLGLGGDEARARITHVPPLSPDWTLERGPIWEQARHLRELANAIDADLIIVDSIVMACAGADPMDTATATGYAAALELIGRPTLSLAHTTKAGDHRYPFGSVFWHNLARTTWSLQRDGERAILTHRKRNNYASLGRFVVTMTWRDDLPREVWERGYSVVLADRIAEILADESLTAEQLVARLNDDIDEDGEAVKANSVRKALARGIPQRFTVSGNGATARYRLVNR